MLRLVPFLLFLLFISNLQSQEIPPITNFYPKEYGGENQNWAISQSKKNKFIYVANNKGLLEFNGAVWHLYPSPNETIFRSVKVYEDKIFTGFFMDFGYWKKNNFGLLEFTSIVKKRNILMLEDEQIWNILEIDGWIIFKSLERIYFYNLDSEEVKIINSNNRITKLSKVDDAIYFQEINEGIFEIQNGVPKLLSNDPILKNYTIVEIFKKNNQLLFLTEENGFYILTNEGLVKWENEASKSLNNTKVYSAIKLKNNDFVLGTVSNGIITLNSKGDLIHQISQNSGLINNTVLSIFEDLENNLWLGLDNGISCINNTSPFNYYKKQSDFLGTVYSSVVYKNNLYLGTNQGLFYKKLNSEDSFEFVENTKGQVWNLTIIDDTLFCGHDSGTFIVKKNKAENIFENQGTWDVLKYNKNLILQGSYDGLYVLKKDKDSWVFSHKLKGFNNSSRYFVLVNTNKIFVNHEYKGVYKLDVDANFSQITNIQKEETINKSTHSSLITYKNKILFSSKEGVFKYNKSKDIFEKDSVFSQLISQDNFTSGKLIYNELNDKLWAFSKIDLKYLTSGKLSNTPIIKTIPILESHRKGASGYENITEINEDKQLIGTSNGFVTVNLQKLKEPKDFIVSIDEIKNYQHNKPKINIDLAKFSSFETKNNIFEIFFSVPNYNSIVITNFQYKLEGLNTDWNTFSTANSAIFENVPHGDYTFKVRALIGDKLSKNIAEYSFNIKKPWYLSNLIITIYILLVLSLIYISHVHTKRYYKKQKQILLEKTKKEAELKELEITQKIIKLNNDKLRSDIESKNKELASSTMNMIKKNEFLNTIKKELQDDNNKSTNQVIKIIDKNLNNTDDWKMFQEAFNNADKKFLKKLKSKHEDLTPNDLRLCAYLRLNLSSKEIAPLLNISPRSVEVKRYRLRKKLNLEHDTNLTNYILDI